jgi:hypothetical protein
MITHICLFGLKFWVIKLKNMDLGSRMSKLSIFSPLADSFYADLAQCTTRVAQFQAIRFC